MAHGDRGPRTGTAREEKQKKTALKQKKKIAHRQTQCVLSLPCRFHLCFFGLIVSSDHARMWSDGFNERPWRLWSSFGPIHDPSASLMLLCLVLLSPSLSFAFATCVRVVKSCGRRRMGRPGFGGKRRALRLGGPVAIAMVEGGRASERWGLNDEGGGGFCTWCPQMDGGLLIGRV